MNDPVCPVCKSAQTELKLIKKSKTGDDFNIHQCTQCGHEYIFPIPPDSVLRACYDASYFTVRTERGYNNYFSDETKEQINRVSEYNLRDIHFDQFEHTLPPVKRSLDIGCAAGYFVELMKSRGWEAYGIDISQECTDYGKKHLKLNIQHGDYLKTSYQSPFDLISMWASIEHLPDPARFLNKARQEIYNSGRLYLSTCRADSFFKKLHRKRWRYYNVPEHIHYFTVSSLNILLQSCGFAIDHYFTYGSGTGRGGSPKRKISDLAAKRFRLGDMIVLSARPV